MTIDKQTEKLITCIAENLPDLDADTMQGWIDNPKGLRKFLLGLNPPKVAESSPDFSIRVDRSVSPVYPAWVTEVLHPGLGGTGHEEYDLSSDVEQWLHHGQNSGRVTGQVIYDHLKASGELALHLGLADFLAIQQKGIAVFRKLYGGKAVFGWKSVVQARDGDLRLPYLYENGDKVVLSWDWLYNAWGCYNPALRFRK